MQRGVSLVELMVGVTIVAILLAFGLPSFSTWIQNSQIRTAAESVQNGLQLARAEAVRRNADVQFALAGTSWTVGCVNPIANPQSSQPPICPASIQTWSGTEGSTNAAVTPTEVLPSGSPAASPVFAGTVVFNGLGRVNTTSLGAGNNASFLVSNVQGNCVACAAGSAWTDCPAPPGGKMRCLRVLVSTGGQVRMCDPALPGPTMPSPTPLGC
jgi:type IV fimbrial biogenesis protein FimT